MNNGDSKVNHLSNGIPKNESEVWELLTSHEVSASGVYHMGQVRESAATLVESIIKYCPACADTAAAVRKVREALMTANCAISLNGVVAEHPDE